MKTITLLEPGRLALGDAPFPAAPGPGEALVRVHRVGVCGTDTHAFAGKQPFFAYPRILGHAELDTTARLAGLIEADGTLLARWALVGQTAERDPA